MQYEYMVIPATRQPGRYRGIRQADARFANSIGEQLNKLAADGWEYVRAESLPAEQRSGIFRKKVVTVYALLVFRRPAPSNEMAGTEEANPFPLRPVLNAREDAPWAGNELHDWPGGPSDDTVGDGLHARTPPPVTKTKD